MRLLDSSRVLFWVPTLIWASTWHVILYQLAEASPLHSVAWRFMLASVVLLAAAMAVVMLLVAEAVFPWANRHLNLRGFAEAARAHYRADIPLAATKEKREAWVFYGGRTVEPVEGAEGARAWLTAGGARDLIVDDGVYQEMRAALPAGARVECEERVSRGAMRLLRYEPGPAAAPAPPAGPGPP